MNQGQLDGVRTSPSPSSRLMQEIWQPGSWRPSVDGLLPELLSKGSSECRICREHRGTEASHSLNRWSLCNSLAVALAQGPSLQAGGFSLFWLLPVLMCSPLLVPNRLPAALTGRAVLSAAVLTTSCCCSIGADVDRSEETTYLGVN